MSGPSHTLSVQHYAALFGEIKQRIRHAQTRAWLAVNAEMIRLYWGIGQVIATRQQQEGYGTAVIPRLARDLHNELPQVKGFSERNINRMLAFYRLYPGADLETELLPQPVAKPAGGSDPALLPKVVPQAVAQLLLSKSDSILGHPWQTKFRGKLSFITSLARI